MLAAGRSLARVLDDPALFARGILRHDLWRDQVRILRSVARNQRTAVKACHSSSKTFTAAEAVLWWISRRPDAVAITTAPTWTQVERLMWGSIKAAAAGARLEYPKPGNTELWLGEDNYAIGISTNQGVRFQGWHGRILIVIDEAVGVRPDIFEAIEGIRAGLTADIRILMLGNPTVAGGPFYDAFGVQRGGWATFTIDGLDTPNTWPFGESPDQRLETILALFERGDERLEQPHRPYLVNARWIAEKYHEWGPKNPRFQSRVRGQFPTQAEDAVYSLAWLEAAQKASMPHARTPPEELKQRLLAMRQEGAKRPTVAAGIDVAGPGEDETVLTIRIGKSIVWQQWWADSDPRGHVVAALIPWREILDVVNVDSVGMGYYFAQHLRDNGFPVCEVNVGLPPTGRTDMELEYNRAHFALLKDQVYWGFRERLEKGEVLGLLDETTIAQLSTVRYRHTPRGQVKVETKDELRERGVKSPDRAESTILAFAEIQSGGGGWVII